MEHGDLGTWSEHRSVVVLEGVLATPTYDEGKRILGVFPTNPKLRPADEWVWSQLGIRSVQTRSMQLNQIFDVVTFQGMDIAEEAAEWLMRYDIRVASVDAVDFSTFCQSLGWSHLIDYVYDTDPSRYRFYGQKGFVVQPTGAF